MAFDPGKTTPLTLQSGFWTVDIDLPRAFIPNHQVNLFVKWSIRQCIKYVQISGLGIVHVRWHAEFPDYAWCSDVQHCNWCLWTGWPMETGSDFVSRSRSAQWCLRASSHQCLWTTRRWGDWSILMGGEDLPIIENKMLNEQSLFQMGRGNRASWPNFPWVDWINVGICGCTLTVCLCMQTCT